MSCYSVIYKNIQSLASGGAKRCHNFTSPARKREKPHALVCIKPAGISISRPTKKINKTKTKKQDHQF